MKRILFGLLVLVAFGGCSSIDIVPISFEESQNAHNGGKQESGYIIHAPMVVVEVKLQYVSTERDGKGKPIGELVPQLVTGKPFALPDFRKPFRIETFYGLGKLDIDNSYTDGWMLSKFNTKYDETALLELVGKAIDSVSPLWQPKGEEPGASGLISGISPGYYRLKYFVPDGQKEGAYTFERFEFIIP